MARAHIAHYMLVRGGLTKDRFERIEGYADRQLKVSDDPNAAQNRRIEILLKPEKT
jgi:chemotaxis protein MotB